MFDLSNKTALVTGSSRGIGRAIAIRLAEAGADVIVNFVTSQKNATEVASEIQKLGRRAATVKADVSEEEDVESLMEFVKSRFGKLDILVSNAASGGFRPIVEATARNFEATMNTNVRALMFLAQRALPLMTPSEWRGKIVALSSHGSWRALPAYGLIGASKAALESLVRHLALELGPLGINVNVVLSGLVETDSTRNLPNARHLFDFVQKKRMVGDRKLLATDVANAVLFLASSLSDLVQGQTLVVDGGEGLQA